MEDRGEHVTVMIYSGLKKVLSIKLNQVKTVFSLANTYKTEY